MIISTFFDYSSVDLLLEGEKSSLTNNDAETKDNTELRMYPEPAIDKFFNVVVVTAPNPSNFFVSKLQRKITVI